MPGKVQKLEQTPRALTPLASSAPAGDLESSLVLTPTAPKLLQERGRADFSQSCRSVPPGNPADELQSPGK